MTDRELDALVAEKVMGWTPCKENKDYWRSPEQKEWNIKNLGSEAGPWEAWIPPHYSTDISAAWEVVEKMSNGKFGSFSLFERRNGWRAGWVAGGADSDTISRAICLAALKAVAKGESWL